MHKGTHNKIPICKSCVVERYEQLLGLYEGNSSVAFQHLCFNLDIFYDVELYLQCAEKDNFIGEYMRLSNTKDRRDKTSLNNKLPNGDVSYVATDANSHIPQELVDFWGEGFSGNTYSKLEKKYKKYTKHYPSDSLQEQEIIKNLCELEVMREECRLKGDNNGYDKLTKQVRNAMDDLNVLPSKMQKYGESDKITPGQLILKVETTEPIPEKHPEFDDVDKIEWWVDRYLARPIRLFFGLESGDLTYEDVENDKYENNKNKRKK